MKAAIANFINLYCIKDAMNTKPPIFYNKSFIPVDNILMYV